MGVKFQTVLFRYSQADAEGVVSLENGLSGNKDSSELVYWLTGAQAGCNINKSLTNAIYDGEHDPDVSHTQRQLETGLQSGQFLFHRVGSSIRVLEDINTFVSFTDDKTDDFSSNQIVRVLDQIATDIAVLFNEKYLGRTPNDAAGRTALWNDIVTHHKALETIRAIENYSPDQTVVAPGAHKKSVVVTDTVTPTYAMTQLYMSVVVA